VETLARQVQERLKDYTGNIVVTSGTLAPLTLTDTFSYVVPGGGKAPTDGGGCIAGATGGLAMLALPAIAVVRKRRRK
jgi:Synergist-CTERM protein sorting domain-containing protein